MKLYANQFEGNLKRGLANAYLIAGDEILLQQECVDALRAEARKQGFTERELYIAERGFDWGQLLAHAGNMSLFAERKIVELRLPTGKVNKDGQGLLLEMLANQPDDVLLIILAPKLERGVTSSKWYKELDKQGVHVDIRPIKPEHMLRWMNERLHKKGLRSEPDAVRLLAERVEGNLLAAAQEIDKISLLFSEGDELTLDKVKSAVAHSARYDVYRLTDAALSGWKRRALKILAGLEAEGNDPILVLWAMLRDLHQLVTAKHASMSGKNINSALRSAGIWDTRAKAFQQAMQTHTIAQMYQFLDHASDIDCVIKGQKPSKERSRDAWHELRNLISAVAGLEDVRELSDQAMRVA